jgi:ribonuclease R
LAKGQKKPAPLPSREQVLDFVRSSAGPVGKREIARAFGLRGPDKIPLKAMLKKLQEEGLLDRGRGRRVAAPGALPPVGVVEITGIDPDGELLARPVNWPGTTTPAPRIVMAPERRGPASAVGDRVLARLTRLDDGSYEGHTVRRLSERADRVLGVYEVTEKGGFVRPTDRKLRHVLTIPRVDTGGAEPGELVLAEPQPGRGYGLQPARIVERLGRTDNPRAISLIAVHTHDIPTAFPPAALAQAEAAQPVTPAGRLDLRRVPLVTIDGADARDFDDAVWAEPDPDTANEGGWHLVVAIADVAHYVRPDDPLDRAAYERGNSVYFPDRVVPMLPEALSNDLCSLRPNEDRACLAAQLWIDGHGRLKRHRFDRAIMRSAARLIYDQVQAALDGRPDDTTGPLLEPVLKPLYGAYRLLARARKRRGTLEIELPERQIVLGGDGKVARIAPRARFDSHKLIEEFMIVANVAAAEALEAKRQPCMYRVHDAPDPERVQALREFLETLGFTLAKGQVLKPAQFNQILERSTGTPHARMIHELVLRSQAQAQYSPDNLGHFGLALRRYAHFTSPIRRYSDLLVHRALIGGFGLGAGGIGPDAGARFPEAGEHISGTERRAVAAERDAADRYIAAFLADRVGATFAGAISGVTRFGLFVTLDETGADGLVPMRRLSDDFYEHDEANHCLVGRSSGRRFDLGGAVQVRLVEADPVTASLLFDLVEGGTEGAGGRPGRGRFAARGRGRKQDRHKEKKGKPKRSKDKRSRRR